MHTGVGFLLQAWWLPVSTGVRCRAELYLFFPKVPILRPDSNCVLWFCVGMGVVGMLRGGFWASDLE